MLSRRAFQQSLVSAAALALGGNLGRSMARAAEQRSYPAGKYVDVHTHVGTIARDEQLTAEGLVRWMDAHDVAQSWVLPLVSPESFRNPVPTEVTLDQCQPFGDRLLPFCSIDPRNSWVGKGNSLLNQLQRYIEMGARGFGEHKVGLPIDEPRNLDLYGAINEVKLPLLVHIDNLRNTDRPGLPGLDKVLTTYPDLVVVGHGPGWWASISGGLSEENLGGYPRGPVQPGGAIDALMNKHPNLYGDLSAGSGVNAMRRDMTFAREFVLRRADRLMFGTDYLSPGQAVGQFELYEELELPADVQRRVFRDNARRLVS